jgi:predicted amidophosphoribosyltransferase
MFCNNCNREIPASLYNFDWDICINCCNEMEEDMNLWIDEQQAKNDYDKMINDLETEYRIRNRIKYYD